MVQSLDVHEEVTDEEDSEFAEVNFNVFSITNLKKCKPYTIGVTVDSKKLEFEVDTGSAISCISFNCYTKMFSHLPLINSNLIMNYYTGEKIYPRGKITPVVKYHNKQRRLDLYVVDKGNNPVLGRQWLQEMEINLQELQCNKISCSNSFNVEMLTSRYCEVSDSGGTREDG